MSLSYVAYPADGVTTQFDLTFGYLSRSHVFVFVDDTLSSYRWITGTRLELGLAPDPGQTVKIQRLTDRVNRLTDFSDGQTLLAGDLDAGDLQNFYILQEIADQVADGVLTGSIPVATASGSANGGFVTEQWINNQLEINAYSTQAYLQLLQQITDEEVARAQAITAEAAARAQAITAEAAARAAAAAQEATDRATAITAEATQRAQDVLSLTQADLAAGQRLGALESTVDTPATGLSAKIATLETVTTDLENNKAEASVVTAIQSDLDDPTTGLKVRATSLEGRTTAVENGKAATSVTDLLNTEINDPMTGLKTRATSLENRATTLENGKAEASALTALTTRVGGAEADIVAEQTARSTADSAFTQQLNTQIARIDGAEADITSVTATQVTDNLARVNDIAVATAATAAAQADATNALSLVATEESSRLTEVSRLDVQFKRGETSINLLRNGHFTYDPVGTVGVPSGWVSWNNGSACIINQDPDNPDRAVLHMDATSAFPNFGVRQTLNSITPGATFTVTTRVRRLSGDFSAAGVHLQFLNASNQIISSASLDFAADGNLEGADALTPDGVVTYSKTVAAPIGSVRLVAYLMGAWTGFGANSAGCQIDWLEVSVKAADAITETALNAKATADAATVAIATESGARVTQTNALSARIDTTEADIVTVEQAIANETSARVDDIAAATASTATAQADATEALGLVADETSARSAAFNSLDARVTSSLANDADFVKNPSASYGTIAGYSGDRTTRDVGVNIVADSGVPSGAAFSRAQISLYIHKPGTGVTANDLGWYKEGGWGGTSIRIRGWFKTPDPTMVAEVGVHLCDINLLTLAWPRIPVSAATETDWVWFDEVYFLPTNFTQEVIMPFIRCTGSGTPLVLFEQLSWVDVSTVQDLSDTVSTQAASIASAQQAIADESTARSSALDTVNARFESNVNHRNIHPMPLFDDDWATVYTAGWDGNHGLPVSRGVNLDPTGAWGGKGGFDVHFTAITGTPASGTVVHDVGLKDDYLIPVVAGGVYFYSVFAAEHRLNQLVLLANRYDTSKTYITSNIIMNSATDLTKTAANGNAENFVRLWGYFTAPETGFVEVYTRGIANGVDTDPYLWTAGYMVARVDTTHDTSKPLPFTASEAAAAKSVAGVKFLKDAFATPNSSTARLLLGVNTANNEAVIEQVAQEGSGVWNGSKIKFTADDFEFNGDVIINGTITADNLAPNAISTQEVFENDASVVLGDNTWVDAATLTMVSVGMGVELRGSATVQGSGFGGGPGTFRYRILRDGVVIKGPVDIPAVQEVEDLGSGVFRYSKSASFVADTNDLAASGTYVYKLQVLLSGNGGTSPTQSVSVRYLSAREFKR